MLKFLNAEKIDSQIFTHSDGGTEEMELYRTKEMFDGEEDLKGKSPSPLAWLKMTCPSTGTNYLIPTDGSFTNCIDSAKYHRPEYVSKDVNYIWQQRN